MREEKRKRVSLVACNSVVLRTMCGKDVRKFSTGTGLCALPLSLPVRFAPHVVGAVEAAYKLSWRAEVAGEGLKGVVLPLVR